MFFEILTKMNTLLVLSLTAPVLLCILIKMICSLGFSDIRRGYTHTHHTAYDSMAGYRKFIQLLTGLAE
jgi:hypothetical protein